MSQNIVTLTKIRLVDIYMINVSVIYIFTLWAIRIYNVNPLVGICIGCEYAYAGGRLGVARIEHIIGYTGSGPLNTECAGISPNRPNCTPWSREEAGLKIPNWFRN